MRRKFPPIPKEDWDFRGIPDEEIEFAFEHEVWRELVNPSEPAGPAWTLTDPQSRKEYVASVEAYTPGPIRVIPTGSTHEAYPTRLLIEIRPLGHSKEEILEAVEKAIDAGSLRDSMGRRGMAGRRPRIEILRGLSAFRLRKAGFSYDLAQAFLAGERLRQDVRGWPCQWPNFATPASWSKAIKRVAREVAAAQAGSDEENRWATNPPSVGGKLS